MVDFSKVNNINIDKDNKMKKDNISPKDTASQNLWDEIGGEVTQSLMAQGNSAEDSKALATKYIDYASATMKEAKDGKNITFDEYKSQGARYEFLGLDKNDKDAEAKLKEVYDSVAGLDGNAGLSAKELVALAMYTDAMNSEKTKDGQISLDGETRAQDTEEGSNFGASKQMMSVAEENGKAVLKDLYGSTFRIDTQIKEAGNNLRNSLGENISKGEITKEQAEGIVKGMEDYLTATMKQKDKDGSAGITMEEYFAEHTGTYSALGLIGEDGKPDTEKGKELFNTLDLDGDGILNVQELSVQYIYRDWTSKDGNLVNIAQEDTTNEKALDGQIHMAKDANGRGIARNLMNVLNMGNTLEERQAALRNFGSAFGLIPENYGRQTGNETTPAGNNASAGSTVNTGARNDEAYKAVSDSEAAALRYQYLSENNDWNLNESQLRFEAGFDPDKYEGTSFIEDNTFSGPVEQGVANYKKAAEGLAGSYMADNNNDKDGSGTIDRSEFEDALIMKLRNTYGAHVVLEGLSNDEIFNKFNIDPNALFNLYNVNNADDVLDMTEIAMSYIAADASLSGSKGDIQLGDVHFDGNINILNQAGMDSETYAKMYNAFYPEEK